MLIDAHPGTGQPVADNATVTLNYLAGTGTVEPAGYADGELRRRRRLPVGP
jgi:hypothetical protein